jgi:hypothetical protein
MSACNYNLSFTGTADALVATLKTQVESNGGTLTGDTSAGSFSVPILGADVAGTYTITGQQIAIIVSKRPFFASCEAIGSYLSSHIS